MKEKSNLSVIIVTRWASEFLKIALHSYFKNSYYDNELIVIADCPSWQTLKVLQEQEINHYTVYFANWDISANFGAFKAHKEYISLSNDDVFYGPHWDKYVLEIMRPNVFGGVGRYELNNGYPCGYIAPDISTFDENLFYAEIEKKKHLPDHIGGVGFALVHHRENFFKYYGYTFHTSQGHGHERKLQRRQSKGLPGFQTIQSMKSGVYHFSSGGNRDGAKIPVPVEDYKLGFRNGLLLCLGCGYKETGWGSDESSKEATEIAERGYFLCKDCKDAGRSDVGKFRLWDSWPREEF